nr:VTT domain-containing protein [Hyphomonas sp. Mor2]
MADQQSSVSQGRKTWQILALIGIGSLALGAAFFVLGPEQIVAYIEAASDWVEANLILSLLLFIIWAFVSQLVISPTGALTLLIGGYLLGGLAGIAYYAMTFVSGLVVYDGVRRGGSSWTLPDQVRGLSIEKLKRAARQEGLGLVATMRVIPFFPPPLVAIASGSLEISRRDFMIGTLTTAWIVPLIVSLFGSTMGSILDAANPDDRISNGMTIGLLLLTLAFSVFIALRLFRRLQAVPEGTSDG